MPSTRDKIRGEYENKIKRSSPPEKIFETFASLKSEKGKLYMTHEDLFEALCPFNYTTKAEEDEREEKKIPFNSKIIEFMIDTNKDGKISIYEYYMVLCLIIKSRFRVNEYFKGINVEEQDKIDKETLKKCIFFLIFLVLIWT